MNKTIELKDDAHCFVCGRENVDGLRLEWRTSNNQTKAEFYPTRSHQGWQGIVHGGIIAAILDEAMTRLAFELYGNAVTAEMNVRYFNPARVGEKLTVTGEVESKKGRLIMAKAEVRNSTGNLIATATGKAIRMSLRAAEGGEAIS